MFANCAIFVQCQSHTVKKAFYVFQRLPNCSCHENCFKFVHAVHYTRDSVISHISNSEKHFHKNSSEKSFFHVVKSFLFNFICDDSVECSDLLARPRWLPPPCARQTIYLLLATEQEIFYDLPGVNTQLLFSLCSDCR